MGENPKVLSQTQAKSGYKMARGKGGKKKPKSGASLLFSTRSVLDSHSGSLSAIQ